MKHYRDKKRVYDYANISGWRYLLVVAQLPVNTLVSFLLVMFLVYFNDDTLNGFIVFVACFVSVSCTVSIANFRFLRSLSRVVLSATPNEDATREAGMIEGKNTGQSKSADENR